MKRRNLACVLGTMVAVMLAGNSMVQAEETRMFGQVISVEEDSVTIVTTQPEGAAGEEAAKPELAPEEGETDENIEETEEKTEEKTTILLAEDTVVKSAAGTEGETASAEDIQVGDSIAVMLTEEGTASMITIMGDSSLGETGMTQEGQAPTDGAASAQMGQPPEGMGGPGGQAPDGAGGPGMGQAPDGTGGPGGQAPDGAGGPGMGGGPGSSGVESYETVNEYTEDATIENEEIVSTGTDENAILVDDAEADVVVSGSAISRDSEDSTGGDNSSFYGVGAAALVTDGNLYLTDSTVTTDASGGAGVFAYGDGTAWVADSTISTTKNTSGGIHAAGGGTLYAWNLDVTTDGESAAAIRSDRGSGTMVVDGGSYTSNGLGSPAIYCTADISVNEAALEATGSEAICIEGLNTIRLYDCDLTGNMKDQEQNDVTWNVIVYQSMSGDSVEGNGTFEMNGGTLTAKNGGMFYTTNTESTITLKNVDITYAENAPFFLQVSGNSNARGWGQTGSNGADCLFTAISQDMQGDVVWDSISQLDLYLTEGSALTGCIRQDETWAGDGGDGYCAVIIDAASSWTVTADSYVTTLSNAGTITDESGATVSIVGTDGTVYVEGESDVTITVESYEETADLSGAATISQWSDVEVEMPEQLA